MNNEESQESGKYVYCIIKAPTEKKSFGNIGFSGQEVYTLEYKDLSPVVSDTPLKDYEVTEDEVELHKGVIENVMKEFSTIPVAYGMAFKNKKLLMIAMKAGYKAMIKAVKETDNKVELGVKVMLSKELLNWDGKTKCKSDFLENLKSKASQTKELKLFSERLLFNSSFLVEKEKIEEFSFIVNELQKKYPELKTQYSGPWPPYNFVDIQILSKKKGGFRK